jgi:hypothetical protein
VEQVEGVEGLEQGGWWWQQLEQVEQPEGAEGTEQGGWWWQQLEQPEQVEGVEHMEQVEQGVWCLTGLVTMFDQSDGSTRTTQSALGVLQGGIVIFSTALLVLPSRLLYSRLHHLR